MPFLLSDIVRKAPDLLFVIPLWALAYNAFGAVFDDDDDDDDERPAWEYLWDDRKNYVDNDRVHSLTFDNVKWAFADGVVLGVYEPISLVIKQVLHSFVAVDPRVYRVMTLYAHAINIYLVFRAGRGFLASACDYDYYREKLSAVIGEKEEEEQLLAAASKRQGSESREEEWTSHKQGRSPGGSAVPRKGRGKKKKNRDGSGAGADAGGRPSSSPEIEDFLRNARAESDFLRIHEAMGVVGCALGAGLFAVHPLQAQTIGWISCLPYCLSCLFSLLSFDAYVAHRSCLREWRRSTRRGGVGADAGFGMFKRPWRLLGGKGGKQNVISSEESEMWLLTFHKAAALIFYVLATFCKAPAVVLPAVFVIVDVFVYSSPLSVHEQGPSIFREAVGAEEMTTKSGGGKGLSSLLPHNLVSRFVSRDVPVLWQLTLYSLEALLMFFALTVFSMIYLVGGNTKTILDPLSMFEKVEKATLAIVWYIVKFFVPVRLVAAVEMHSFSFLDHWEVAVSLVAVPYVTLVILAYSTSNTPRRLLACAWGVFIALLLPSLGFIQHGRMFLAADRYMYIPLAMAAPIVGAIASGWFTVAVVSSTPVSAAFVHAGGPVARISTTSMRRKGVTNSGVGYYDASSVFDRLSNSRSKAKSRRRMEVEVSERRTTRQRTMMSFFAFICYVSVVVGLFSFSLSLSPSALFYWRNTKLLWERNLEIIPDSENAHVNLSALYASSSNPERDLDKALIHATAADELRPNHPKYQFNIAELYRLKGDNEEAKDRFLSILRDGPPGWIRPEIHFCLGLTLRSLGEDEASKRELELAASLGKTKAKSELDKLNEKILHRKKS